MTHSPIRSILIANRSEIAIRVMRAASEMRIRTVAIYSQQDRQALHRFKADESYLVGEGKKPLAAYLDGEDILRIARSAGADAIHPGYGFLSENADFAQAVIDAGLVWIGPPPSAIRAMQLQWRLPLIFAVKARREPREEHRQCRIAPRRIEALVVHEKMFAAETTVAAAGMRRAGIAGEGTGSVCHSAACQRVC